MRTLATSILLPALLLTACGKTGAGSATNDYKIDRTQNQDNYKQFRGPAPETLESWGKPFVVMLWSSNCPTCDTQLANINALAMEGKLPVYVLNIDPTAKPDALTPLAASRGYKAIRIKRGALYAAMKPQPKDIASNMFEAHDPGMVFAYDHNAHKLWSMTGVADFKSPEVQKLLAEAK
jgi:thiol-disulfide isomerase/thioredoxin